MTYVAFMIHLNVFQHWGASGELSAGLTKSKRGKVDCCHWHGPPVFRRPRPSFWAEKSIGEIQRLRPCCG